jgi:hypothetical protein
MNEVLMNQDMIPVEEWDSAFFADETPIEETQAYKDWLARFEYEHFSSCEFDI